MIVTVNGQDRELAGEMSVDDLVAALSPSPRGIAVVVNGTVVPRSEWPARRLGGDDAVEVITAVQGG